MIFPLLSHLPLKVSVGRSPILTSRVSFGGWSGMSSNFAYPIRSMHLQHLPDDGLREAELAA